jgi:hypothetical protein
MTAVSAFQIVSGIDGPALGTGIFFSFFQHPFFITGCFDLVQVIPQFDAMGHGGLELFQIITGVLFTLTAKVNAPFRCTGVHFAGCTIGNSFVRPATVTPGFFFRKTGLCGQSFKSVRFFGSGYIPGAGLAEKTADRG